MTFLVAVIAYFAVGMAFYMTLTRKGPSFIELVANVHKAGAVLKMTPFNNWVSSVIATLFVLAIWPLILVVVILALFVGEDHGTR